MSTGTRILRLGRRHIPVILPNRRDARLHTASVIISIHVIGITALGFAVSIPQILSAILTAALIDVAISFRQTGKLVWPASGMLTGSGVALIMRLVGMGPGDYWSWNGWHWFALVAGASVLTKYLIRFKGSHIFNPSNIGLVLAFVVLGGDVVEPLDFWWAPLGLWMGTAYALILVGGILVTRRLGLLEMAVVFWAVLAAGLAVLSASGHCMIATWSPSPVCDDRFWTSVVTSPEVLIFLFFMITDPKTVPTSRAGRALFAAAVGAVATLLIAPAGTEYWAKVGLLASLALLSPTRLLFDHAFSSADGGSGVAWIGRRLTAAPARATFGRGVALGSSLVLFSGAVLFVGGMDRIPASADVASTVLPGIDRSRLPPVEVDDSVRQLDIDFNPGFVSDLAANLAENLAIEEEAMRTANSSLLASSSGGEHLDEVQERLDEAVATGKRIGDRFTFDSLSLSLHEAPEGQSSAGLVFSGAGYVDHITYDTKGEVVARAGDTFALDFVMRLLAGERWLLVSVEPAG
jgi:hypothetical protein